MRPPRVILKYKYLKFLKMKKILLGFQEIAEDCRECSMEMAVLVHLNITSK